jgi:hypothetical protein
VVLYLWETLARGKECGELLYQHVEFGEQVAYPGWSKTVRRDPSTRIPLAAPEREGRPTFLEAALFQLPRVCLRRQDVSCINEMLHNMPDY